MRAVRVVLAVAVAAVLAAPAAVAQPASMAGALASTPELSEVAGWLAKVKHHIINACNNSG